MQDAAPTPIARPHTPLTAEQRRRLDERVDRALRDRSSPAAATVALAMIGIAFVTPMSRMHPVPVGWLVGAMVAIVIARVIVSVRFRIEYARNAAAWRRAFLTCVVGMGTVWSLFAAYTIGHSGFSPTSVLAVKNNVFPPLSNTG